MSTSGENAGKSIDVNVLVEMAERDDLPDDVRTQLALAALAISTLANAYEEQDAHLAHCHEHVHTAKMLLVAMIHASGGALYIPKQTLREASPHFPVDRTEPYDRDGYMFRINMDKWPGTGEADAPDAQPEGSG